MAVEDPYEASTYRATQLDWEIQLFQIGDGQ
jgi:hypothetical protein